MERSEVHTKMTKVQFSSKKMQVLKRRRKRLYYTDSRARIRLFLPSCNISYNVDCLSNYLLNSSVPKNIQKLFNRSLAFINIIHDHQLWAIIMLANRELAYS